MQYELVLKNEKIKNYRLIARLVILLGCIFTVALVIYTSLLKVRIAGIITLSIIAGWVLWNYYLTTQKKQTTPYETTALLLLAICLAISGINWLWLAVIFLIIAGLYTKIIQPIIIIFNKDGINISSFPAKNFGWQQLNNVVLRDNLITLDFNNNKLLQQPIINTHWDVNPKEFNEFCKKMLGKKVESNN